MGKPVITWKIFSWSMYDFANTAFSALFVSFFFPFFIKEFLGGNEFQIGLVMGVSMGLVAILVPFLGAFVDLTGKHNQIIKIFTVLCVACTALVAYSSLYMALFFGMLANFFYHGCLVVYNAILPTISKKKDMGYISGFGVAIGYLGTFVSLGMAAIILSIYGWESEAGIRLIFPATAIFFMSFSMLLFIYVKDKVKKNKKPFHLHFKPTFYELKKTFFKIPKYKGLLPFLLSSFAYSNAITAAIIFIYLYARETIHMDVMSFMGVYVIFALAASAGSYLAGPWSDRYGPRTVLAGSGIVWIIALVFLFFPTLTNFIIVGVLGGAAMGAIWTANRPMIISLAPKEKVGQFFGFDELADKFSGVIEPVIFGFLVVTLGYPAAISSLIVFFVIGLWLLKYVPNKTYH